MNWFLENHQGGWKLEARGWFQRGRALRRSSAALPGDKLEEILGSRSTLWETIRASPVCGTKAFGIRDRVNPKYMSLE